MKIIVYAITLAFYSSIIWGQNSETISSGRPGISIGADVVGSDIFQIQSGVTYNELESSGTTKDWVLDNFIRYGISDSFELNTTFNYKTQENFGSGVDNLMLGGRYNFIAAAKGLIPALALQTRFRFKGEGDFKRDEMSPEFIISTIHDLKSLGVLNINLSYDDNAGDSITMYIVNWTYTINDKWSVFLEKYATYQNDQCIDAWDTGAAYLINKDLQLDLSFGYDLESEISSSFYSGGVSWRTSLI